MNTYNIFECLFLFACQSEKTGALDSATQSIEGSVLSGLEAANRLSMWLHNK